MDIEEDWWVWCVDFFDKKTGSGSNLNEVLAKEWHKPLIKKFQRRKVYAMSLWDNIWAADLAEIGSLSSFNCGIKYLSFYIYAFYYDWFSLDISY